MNQHEIGLGASKWGLLKVASKDIENLLHCSLMLHSIVCCTHGCISGRIEGRDDLNSVQRDILGLPETSGTAMR